MQHALLRVVLKGKIVPVEVQQVLEEAGRYPSVLVDLGTGDGKFPYREAVADPRLLCIGIDATPNEMTALSQRIGRKRQRGGVDNLILIACPVDQLPANLLGIADRLTINFPWGSLLRDLLSPDPAVLATVRRLMKPEAKLDLLLNLHTLREDDLRLRLDLPEMTPAYFQEYLQPAYSAAGLGVVNVRELAPGELPVRTTWGQHLTLNSKRNTLWVEAIALDPSSDGPDAPPP